MQNAECRMQNTEGKLLHVSRFTFHALRLWLKAQSSKLKAHLTPHASRFTFHQTCLLLLCLVWAHAGVYHEQSAVAQGEVTLTLERAVQLALQHNEVVLKAQTVVNRAQANLRVARAVYLPHVGLTGFYERRKNEAFALDEKDYLSRIEVSQLLAQFGAVPNTLDAAQEAVREADIELESAKKAVIFELRELWHDMTLTEAEIAQRSEVSQTLQEKLKAAQIKHAEKRLPLLSVLNTELELAEQQLALNELRRRLEVNQATLIRLTGLDPLVDVRIVGEVPEDDFTLPGAVTLALANRLDVVDLQGQIQRQERLANETLWHRIPNLTAEVRYRDFHLRLAQQDRTWDTSAIYDLPLFERETAAGDALEMAGEDREGWEVRFNWNIALYDGGETQARKAAETSELERLGLELVDLEKAIRVEVRRELLAVTNAKERMEIEGKRVEIFEQRLRTIERVLNEGLDLPSYRGLTFDDAFSAQAQFTEAQRVFYQARRDYATAKEQLRRTMGYVE